MPAAGSKRGEPRGERKSTGYLPPRGPTPASMAAMQWNPSVWPFRSREESTFPEALPLHRPGLVLGSGYAQVATVYLPGTSHVPGAGARACKPILFSHHNHVLHLTGHSQGRAHVSPSDWGFLRWKGCYHPSEKGFQGGAVIFHLSSPPSYSSGVRAAILSPSLQGGRRLLAQVTSIIQPGHSPGGRGEEGGEGRASWA